MKIKSKCANKIGNRLFWCLVLVFLDEVCTDCFNEQWDCDDGRCIEKEELCDGVTHCNDGSDEIAENCIHFGRKCPAYAFRCAYGACITGKLKCNGIKNCVDNSDEVPLLCASNASELRNQIQGNCSESSFMQCNSGECIVNDNRCDGKIDCPDGSDETVELCSPFDCASFAFRCGYGACIAGKLQCNGVKDCLDGSDEAALLCDRPRNNKTIVVEATTPGTLKSLKRGVIIPRPQIPFGERPDFNTERRPSPSLYLPRPKIPSNTSSNPPDTNDKFKNGLIIPRPQIPFGEEPDLNDNLDRLTRPRPNPSITIPKNTLNESSNLLGVTESTPITIPRPQSPRPPLPFIENDDISKNKGGNNQRTSCEIPYDTPNLLIYITNKRRFAQPGELLPQNTLLSFSCDKGLTSEGELQAFCNKGDWNNLFPRCRKYCDPKELTSGFSTDAYCTKGSDRVSCSNIHPGTVAHLDCAYGFYKPRKSFAFNDRLTCKDTASWDLPRKSCEMDCGQVIPKTTIFIKGGADVNITQAPWHVAIYSIFNEDTYSYTCGGSIISPRLVLSAAHCFWDKANFKLFNETFFSVAGGKFYQDYYSSKDINSQKSGVLEIHVPETYKDHRENYGGDIAVVVLKNAFKFTDSIRPICLIFNDNAEKDVRTNFTGSINGWGFNNNFEASPTLQTVSLRAVSYRDCSERLIPVTDYKLPSDKFCLYSNYDQSACRGDSGGGFVSAEWDRLEQRNYYKLTGIISHTPVQVQSCSRNGLVAMTNIQYYREIIRRLFLRDANDF